MMEDDHLNRKKLQEQAQRSFKSKSEQLSLRREYLSEQWLLVLIVFLLIGGIVGYPYVVDTLNAPECVTTVPDESQRIASPETYWHETLPDGCRALVVGWRPKDRLFWQGDCRDGQADGRGKLRVAAKNDDGTYAPRRVIYDGPMQEGMATGKAFFSNKDGTTYEGYFENSMMAGEGTFRDGNGMRYVGNWEGGLPNGDGAYVHEKNNARLSGRFKDGHMVGLGELTAPDTHEYYCNGEPVAAESDDAPTGS